MPMHNWTQVPDGIYHAFHHRWISAVCDDLNTRRLPADYYALPEQVAAGMAEAESESYRRRKKSVVVRHVSDDRVLAVVEIASPGNKSTGHAFHAFVEKALELLERRIHLLVIDPFPPGRRDPNGIHAAIWEAWTGEAFELPDDKRLTLVSYECGLTTRAYIEPVAVGDALPDMALFIEPENCVMAPLEATYQAAYAVMPSRWRNVLDDAKSA